MATVAFYAPAAAGHVNPTLGLAAELVRRGHRVTYATTPAYAERVAETGAEVVPVTSTWEGRRDVRTPQMHGRELARAMNLLLTETRSMLAQLADAERPDLVVHDGPMCWWGRILARRWQLPSVETWPNLVSNEHWSMARAYTTFNPLSPRFLLMAARISRFLQQRGAGAMEPFMRGDSAALRLVTLPRAFQYAGDTFTDRYEFVGPLFSERAYQGDWAPPGDLPVVLVSLGTAYNDRPDFYRTVLRSAETRPWHVVLAIGDVDPAALGPVPPTVEIHRHVPQLAVLRHARAFVTHAGMGSTMEALHFQVPMVAIPQMAEQRANADRIAELGLGTTLPPAQVTADTLWTAIDEVTTSHHIRTRLTWMRDELTTAGGTPAAADATERLLP
ncbi:macrolide family glycosyltransferase [Catenuloplanes atrovinosus]|uniref:MGT family glycosyltransferase n=1 Tax=Catenuloplanes atrovinosus TaxID=137266 RepID=A0AAE3YH20_9ACTN|nr:macrolide family glycosyltransferase [Catenuloplanes atrovinosus]MDR7273773.1 MGT family glycosyltransferase [Catenuloplanes atrovinosus]